MKAAIFALVTLPLALVGCAEPERTRERAPGGQPAGERLASSENNPAARPVRIGEGGPRFAACQGRGLVGAVPGEGLPVRDAPFDRAGQVGAVTEGQRLFICTRSLDQQWLGVVVSAATPPGAPTDSAPALTAPDVDCGVSAPVRTKRAYDGPCLSGWVESTFVAVVAN